MTTEPSRTTSAVAHLVLLSRESTIQHATDRGIESRRLTVVYPRYDAESIPKGHHRPAIPLSPRPHRQPMTQWHTGAPPHEQKNPQHGNYRPETSVPDARVRTRRALRLAVRRPQHSRNPGRSRGPPPPTTYCSKRPRHPDREDVRAQPNPTAATRRPARLRTRSGRRLVVGAPSRWC